MFYVLNITEIIPGKMAEYNKLAQEMATANDRLGYKRVVSMQPYSGNMNQLFTLFAFNDLNEERKLNAASGKDKDAQKLSLAMNALRVSHTRIILQSSPWMKT
jgi:hypothetical protein